MTALERRYRLLLRAYPRSYRVRRGEEMLDTLLEGAAPGRTSPSWRDAADLLAGGMGERFGTHAVPGFANGLRLAGPIALAMAAAVTGSVWLQGDPATATTVVAAAWAVAVLARASLPRTGALPALGALLVTVGAVAAVGTAFAGVALVGVLAALGTVHPAGPVERVAVPASSVLITAFVVFAWYGPAAGRHSMWMRHDDLVTAGMLGLILAGAVTLGWRRDARPWWALLILLTAVPAVVVISNLPLSWANNPWWHPAFGIAGTTPAVCLIALAMLAVCVHVRRTERPLAYVAVLSMTMAAGLSLFAWFIEAYASGRPWMVAAAPAYLLFILAAVVGPGRTGWSRWLRSMLTAGAVVGALVMLATLAPSVRAEMVTPEPQLAWTLVLLGLCTLLSPRDDAAVRSRPTALLRRIAAVAGTGAGILALVAITVGLPGAGTLQQNATTVVWQEALVPSSIGVIAFVATAVGTAVAVLQRDRNWAVPLGAFALAMLGVVVFNGVFREWASSSVIVAGSVGLLVAVRFLTRTGAVSRTTPGIST